MEGYISGYTSVTTPADPVSGPHRLGQSIGGVVGQIMSGVGL